MKQEIKLDISASVPVMAIVTPFILGLTQPFLAWTIALGFMDAWAQGDVQMLCLTGFFSLMELIMLPACWILFFWLQFGTLRLRAEKDGIGVARSLFGIRLRGKGIPLNAQSYFRLMTRTVLNQSMKSQMTINGPRECTQQEYEIGVADAQKFYSIITFHDRERARKLIRELHAIWPALPADENGTPFPFTH